MNMPRPEIVRPCLKCAASATSSTDDALVRRAVDMDAALAVGDEVAGVDLELGRGHFQHHLAGLARRHHDGVADAVSAAAGEGAHAMRAGVGVGRVDHHAVIGHAERLGGDLRADGLDALAEIDARTA